METMAPLVLFGEEAFLMIHMTVNCKILILLYFSILISESLVIEITFAKMDPYLLGV